MMLYNIVIQQPVLYCFDTCMCNKHKSADSHPGVGMVWERDLHTRECGSRVQTGSLIFVSLIAYTSKNRKCSGGRNWVIAACMVWAVLTQNGKEVS